jgi:hypothetical protein
VALKWVGAVVGLLAGAAGMVGVSLFAGPKAAAPLRAFGYAFIVASAIMIQAWLLTLLPLSRHGHCYYLKPHERKAVVIVVGLIGLYSGFMHGARVQQATPWDLTLGCVGAAFLGAVLAAQVGELVGEMIEAVRSLRSR